MKWQQVQFVCFVLCAILKFQVGGTDCPRNWRNFKGFCYLDTKSLMTYEKGRHFCDYFLDSSLLQVKDMDENNFVKSLISQKSWLGFRRCNNQRFFWTDSEPANFTSWDTSSGQPDNRDTNEQCVAMSADGKWSDYICFEKKSFVCQETSKKCSNVTDCFHIKHSLAKWDEARSLCEAQGLRLAKISNSNENNGVVDLLGNVNQAWIGLRRKNNFCHGNTAKTSFHLWDFHEPNDERLAEDCVAIGAQGKWSDEECNASLSVICKRDIDECLSKEAHGCDENAVCTNTVGSFTCDTCKDGYSRDGSKCSRKEVAAIVLGSLFAVCVVIILLLILYILRKSRRWTW